MTTRKSKHKVQIGDVYAVPLDSSNQRYGYVRMYHDPDVAILAVTSGQQLLELAEVEKYPIVRDVGSLRTNIEKGQWPILGNLPFGSEEEAWPGPRKQVSKIRPDIKKVVFKGHFISAEKFGEYENLPVFTTLTDEELVEEINSNPNLFHYIG